MRHLKFVVNCALVFSSIGAFARLCGARCSITRRTSYRIRPR